MATPGGEITKEVSTISATAVNAGDAIGDLGVILIGGKRPAMVTARAMLRQLTARVHEVADVDEAVLGLFVEAADLLVIDGSSAGEYRADLISRAVPALLADQIAVLWIGNRDGATFSLDRKLTEVVLDELAR